MTDENKTPEPEPEIEILESVPEHFDDIPEAASAQSKVESEDGPEVGSEWKQKHDQVKDQLLWVAADFENYKKRALKEKEEHHKFSLSSFIKDLLGVVDNLQRALGSMPPDDGNDKALTTLRQGVEMTLRQFYGVLENHGVKRIEALGTKFDPRFHEVILQVDSTEHEDETVVEEIESGFTFHDRVLRPSRVKVARNTKT